MKVKYMGPHDAVDVPLPDGRVVAVAHGEELPVDLPDAFGKSLLEQESNWASAEPARRKPKEG